VKRADYERLRWRCRRGLLELDLVFERFLERHAARMTEAELASLGELLEYPDNDLWEVVSGRSDRYDPRLEGIVSKLRST
jgi:antitoxin CptB